MEVRARLRYMPGAAQKVRLVVDQIRGRNVEEAASILRATQKAAAAPVAKLLRSAIANAEQRVEGVDVGRLYIKQAYVDGGPALKRIRPATQGRAFRVLKRRSHVTLVLGLLDEKLQRGK
jgi:large subunit ribosomal protein L22